MKSKLKENINKGLIDKDSLDYIKELIKSINIGRYKNLAKYYENDTVTLKKNRILKGAPNNKIMANYARYITEINVGYFMGNDIIYAATKDSDIEPVLEVFNKNSLNAIDKQNAKKLSKYGKCYELVYIDEESEINSKNIDVRNGFILKDDTLDEKEIIACYFTLVDKEEYYVYLYTDTHELTLKTNFKTFLIMKYGIHYFEELPLIEFRNNEEAVGDFENVTTLIDAYNKVLSNDIDNVEDFIDSILLITGNTIDADQMELLRETRGLNLTDGKAEFLTKVLDETGVTQILDRLRRDIHKFSFTPDISDENFSGNSSGVALEYKLLPFELLTKTKQANYEKALKKRFSLYNKYLNTKKNMPIIPVENVEIQFNRGLPKNDLEVAEIISRLQGLVSNETLISRLSFIKDASVEQERLQTEELDGRGSIVQDYINQTHFTAKEKDSEGEEWTIGVKEQKKYF